MEEKTQKKKLYIWPLLLSGAVLMSLPFLVPHAGFLALFGLVPLLIAERRLTDNNVKGSFWLIYLFFLLFNTATTFWIWNISAAGAIAAIALNALQMAVIFQVYRFGRRKVGDVIGALLLCCMWIAWERVYCNIEISWPWLILGNSFAKTSGLVQWYEYTGALGGSLWIFICNLFLYAIIEFAYNRRDMECTRLEKRQLSALKVAWAVFLLAPMGLSLVLYRNYKETGNPREVVVVQPNIDPVNGKYGGVQQRVLDENLLAQAEKLTTDLTSFVVTPETFTYNLDLDKPQDNQSYLLYKDFIARHPQVNFLFGALTHRIYVQKEKPSDTARPGNGFWYETFNSAILIDSTGVLRYGHKSKLVPGVEIIPYQKYVPWLGNLVAKFGGSLSSYTREKNGMAVLKANDGTLVSAPICYESVYSDYCREAVERGAQIFAVITNDGWWGDTPGYRQHFDYARLRAIETRRDIIHCANTGTSAIINQRGDSYAKTKYWTAAEFVGNVNLNDSKTFFVQHGDIVGRLCSFFFILLLLITIVEAILKKRGAKAKA